MEEFKAVMKIFALSLAIIVLMQLKFSNDTIENHFEGWVQTSNVGTYLQNVADGAVKLGHAGINAVSEYTHEKFNYPAHLPFGMNSTPKHSGHVMKSSAPPARVSATVEDDLTDEEID